MSPIFKFAMPAALILALSATTLAADHPHDKKTADPAQTENETIVQFEEDINAHFEKHAKALREAMNSVKDTKSRIIVKELNSTDGASLAGGHASKTTKRIEIIENPDELREAARSIQNLLADSGILESLAEVVIDLAEDIEIDDTGNGMRLSFNGNRIGGFSMDQDNDRISIETMGNNTTIEKEVFIENGKKKTRIVIETDGDDVDFDIVPKPKKPRANSEF